MNNLGLDPTLGLIRWYVMWYNMMCPLIFAMWCWFPFVKLRSFVYNAVKHNLIEGVAQPRWQWWSQSHLWERSGFSIVSLYYICNSTVVEFSIKTTSDKCLASGGNAAAGVSKSPPWPREPWTATRIFDCFQHTFVDDISKLQKSTWALSTTSAWLK